MGHRYWVGGTATWDSTAGTKWATTSGGAGGASVPTSADNVYLDANSGAVTVTISSSSICESLYCTGFTGTLSHPASVTLSVYGSLTFVAGMTYTKGSTTTSAISFLATSTGHYITTASKVLGNITFNGVGGGWALADALTANGSSSSTTITLQAGTFDSNGLAVNFANFYVPNTSLWTLTMRSSAWSSASTSNTAWQILSSGGTLNSGTSTITFSSTAGFVGGGKTYYNVTFNSNTSTIGGANTFNNLTVASAATISSVTFSANQTINGTLSIQGSSATNRIAVESSSQGTAVTLTAAAVSLLYADFTDITAGGAAAPFTGTSLGNGGNNTNITTTTPVTRYWVGNGGSWSSTTHWSASSGGASGASVPLLHDTVVFNASSITSASQTITLDLPRVPTLDFTNVLNTPTLTNSTTLKIYGSLTFKTALTITSNTNQFGFYGRSAAIFTTANKTLGGSVYVATYGTTLTVVGNLTLSNASYNFTVSQGTVNYGSGSYSIAGAMSWNSGTTANLDSSAITLTGTGTVLSVGSTASLDPGTSTITISNATATSKTFAGGSRTYNSIVLSGDNIIITGSNTFSSFAVNNAGQTTGLKLTSGTTQTITSTFSTNGSAGSLAKISSTTAASAASLSKSSGLVVEDYMSLQDNTATGGATWYAGANSTNVSGNTGWTFRKAFEPTGISSSAAFGSPSMTLGILLSGLTSTAIGIPIALAAGVVAPSGIASTVTFGIPTVTATAQYNPAGMPSSVSFGTIRVASFLASATVYTRDTKNKTSHNHVTKQKTTRYFLGKDRTSYSHDR